MRDAIDRETYLSVVHEMDGYKSERDRYKRERDELLAALKAFVERAEMDFQETFKREIKAGHAVVAKVQS